MSCIRVSACALIVTSGLTPNAPHSSHDCSNRTHHRSRWRLANSLPHWHSWRCKYPQPPGRQQYLQRQSTLFGKKSWRPAYVSWLMQSFAYNMNLTQSQSLFPKLDANLGYRGKAQDSNMEELHSDNGCRICCIDLYRNTKSSAIVNKTQDICYFQQNV